VRADPREIARFGVIGIVASLLHIAVALGLIEIGALGVYGANAFAFGVALIASYVGHHRWTFDRRGGHGEHFPRFVATALLGFVLNQGIIALSIEVFGLPYWIGILIVVAIVPAIVYLLCKLWAFATDSGAPDPV
jgi:putative flippase GtrA